ncbi:MAG: hypothetical protein OER95_02090 [Acidimicrobiia bacterium]|nr:hypothetical protein [Acidimicrobiia bacterium]
MAPDNHSRPTSPAWAAVLSSGGRSMSLLDGADGTTFDRFWLRDLCPSLPGNVRAFEPRRWPRYPRT